MSDDTSKRRALNAILRADSHRLDKAFIENLYNICHDLPLGYIPSWLQLVTKERSEMFKPGNEDYEVDAAAENLPVEIGPLSDTRNQYKVLAFFVDCSTFSRGESQFEVGANYLGENMRTEYEECKQKARDSGCPLNRLVVCPFPNSSEGDESDDQGVYLVNGTDSVTSRPRDQDDIWQACCACIFNGEPEKCAFRVSELNRLTDAALRAARR